MQEVRALSPIGRSFSVEHFSEATVVRFIHPEMTGLDAAHAMELRLSRLAEGIGRRLLVLNFSGVPLLTSALLGKLITLNTKVRKAGGLLTLCALGSPLLAQLERTRLNTLFAIYASEQEALEADVRGRIG